MLLFMSMMSAGATSPASPSRDDTPFATRVLGPGDPKWVAIVGKIAADRAALAECRHDVRRCTAPAGAFLALIQDARSKVGRAQVGEVNRAVNLAIAYRPDPDGVDTWNSPLETFAHGNGDCEDYAIAKMSVLLELGFRDEDLRLVPVRNVRSGEDHMVLGVRFDDGWLVLDSVGFALARDTELTQYAPLLPADPASPLVAAAERELPVTASSRTVPRRRSPSR
jgi:predicted transglutaminase-like cysteine proteinase